MPENLQVSVGAAKDIREGEEITISCEWLAPLSLPVFNNN
jgi:hypothetical protein